MWQSSGNRIVHNTIHHTGYTAICVTGRIIFDPSGRGEASKSVRWDEIREDTDVGDTPETATRPLKISSRKPFNPLDCRKCI